MEKYEKFQYFWFEKNTLTSAMNYIIDISHFPTDFIAHVFFRW